MPTITMADLSDEPCGRHLSSPEDRQVVAEGLNCDSTPIRAWYMAGDRIGSTLKRVYIGTWSTFTHYAFGLATLRSSQMVH